MIDPLTGQDLVGAMALLAYYITFAAAIGLLTRLVALPREWIRKGYHVFCSLSVFILVLCFEHWHGAVLAISLLMLSGYVLLLLGERIPFASAVIDRGAGLVEIREHLLLLLASMVTLLTLFWGLAGEQHRYAIAVGLLVWGFGDAVAALVGTGMAKRRFRSRLFDPRKSPLGTFAMMATSFLVCAAVLALMAPLPPLLVVVVALVLGFVAGIVEAATRHGLDTLTLPLAAAGCVWLLVSAAMLLDDPGLA